MHDPTAFRTRRRLIGALALAPAALASRAWAQEAVSGLIAPRVCRLAPELAEGPFYLDPGLVRRDVTEGRPGVPVELALQVTTAACTPLPGARVDLWHCDAIGAYSGVEGVRGTFLRGTQFGGADGVVRFRTVYPGWYEGRTTHFHVKVLLGGGFVLTSQIFLPDALSQHLYDHVAPYAARGRRRRVFNSDDAIALRAGAAASASVRELAGRYLVELVLAVDPSAPAGPAPPRRAPRRAGPVPFAP